MHMIPNDYLNMKLLWMYHAFNHTYRYHTLVEILDDLEGTAGFLYMRT